MASPIENAFGFLGKNKDNFLKGAWSSIKNTPPVGPAARAWEYLLTDPDDVPEYTPSKEDLDRRAAFQESMQANQNRSLNQQAMDNLRQQVAEMPRITNADLRAQARKQLTPVYRPLMRSTRKSIRQTERQGRVAARDVQSYYNQAGAKIAGIGRSGRKSTGRAIKKINSGGVQGNAGASAEAKIAAKAVGGMGKANASFFKQLRGAVAGEGAVAAADTRRSYKDVANQYRGDLAQLQSERAAAIQQLVQKKRQNINRASNNIVEDVYLGQIAEGKKPRQAQRAAMAYAQMKSPSVQQQVASSILNSRGNEDALISAMAMRPQTADEQEMAMKNQELAIDQLNAMSKFINPDSPPEGVSERVWALFLQQLGAQGK